MTVILLVLGVYVCVACYGCGLFRVSVCGSCPSARSSKRWGVESSDGEPTHLQGMSLEVMLSPRQLLRVPGLIPGNDFELWPAVDPLPSPPLACLARPGTHTFPNDAPPCLWLKHLVAQLCLEFGWNPARRRSSHLPSENIAFHARCCWGTGRTGCQPPRMTQSGSACH